MQRLAVLGWFALISGSSLAAQPYTTHMEAVPGSLGALDEKTTTEDVPLRRDAYERMTVPVRLGANGPFRFLVDTGADRTAISRELAERLNLAAGAQAELHSLTGDSSVATAKVHQLQLTKASRDIVEAAVLDRSNMGADGILGVDSLASQRILFDFDKQTLSIVPSASREDVREPDAIVVTARRRNGHLIITEALANDHPVTVVLDTGAQVSIGNTAFRRQLLGNRPVDPSREVELQSVTGQAIRGEYLFVRELDLGGCTLKDLAVVFADAHTFSTLKLKDQPTLLLGMNAMRAFKKVSIDFAKNKLRVLLPEHSQLDVRFAEVQSPLAH